jgi:hypothetical protein
MLDPTSTSRKPAQMVWACVWLDKCGRARRSKLVIMERNPDAKKCGYSVQGYCWISGCCEVTDTGTVGGAEG